MVAEGCNYALRRNADPLAERAQLDVHEVSPRLAVFRDPELHPAVHSRLVEMFTEVGIPVHLACVARTPSEIQWMVIYPMPIGTAEISAIDSHDLSEAAAVTLPSENSEGEGQ